ncbi:hypothetical protein HOP50_03g25900 [Chloropicon primus]|nr:hypothetical protein HOP50_03g25900 [Chloropicon primus]
MAVRRLRRTRTRRLVQLVKPRVTAIITKKGWEDILRKSKGKTLVVMFRGEKSTRDQLLCHRFEPIFAELSKKKEYSQLMFAKVDGISSVVDTSQIKQLPTFMCFRDGRLIETCEANSPMAVKAMLQRVSESTGIARFLSNVGRFTMKCLSTPLRPVGVVLRPKLWKAVVASPLFVLAYLKVMDAQEKKAQAQKIEERKKMDAFLALVKLVGFRRAKQLQRLEWLLANAVKAKEGSPSSDFEDKKKEMETNYNQGKKEVMRRKQKSFAISVRRVPARGRVYLGEKAPRAYFWK